MNEQYKLFNVDEAIVKYFSNIKKEHKDLSQASMAILALTYTMQEVVKRASKADELLENRLIQIETSAFIWRKN